MPIGASSAPVVADNNIEAAIEVDVRDRWDALALSESLVPFQSFLVQHSADRWVVHARSPGWHGESLLEAFRAIEEWRAERGLHAPVRVNAQTRGG